LRRFINRGKGVAIKSFPDLNVAYVRKLHELKPDVVFILDKPIVSEGFINAAREMGLPIVWIDHHPLQQISEGIYYFNPLQNEPKTMEPVAYWCYKAVETEKDLWIAMLGCLADWFLPEFTEKFQKKYSDIFSGFKNVEEAMYKTEFGKLLKLLNFALKDKTSNVVKLLRDLYHVDSPYDLLRENSKFEKTVKHADSVTKKYNALIEKAKEIAENAKDRLLFFRYGGTLSLSGDLSNEIYYNYPDRIVVVAYVTGEKVNISLRGKIDVRIVVKKALEGIEGTGGGHEHACGSTISLKDLPKYIENIQNYLKTLKN
jgi:single-stranded DNA-specific DHH superfamily exonuclease